MAVGSNFYGVFSANNTPDLANFPNGVTFLRNANFITHQLLDVNNTTPVAISIDPFFFEVKGTKVRDDYDGDGKTDWRYLALRRHLVHHSSSRSNGSGLASMGGKR